MKKVSIALLVLLGCADARAADRLCDVRYEDCRTPLLALINAEPAKDGAIDVAFWFMTDDRYRYALQQAYQRGVRVRVLVDPRANDTKRYNQEELQYFQTGKIPMRMKAAKDWSDILHWKLMHFHAQRTVEFSAANYTEYSFVPATPYENYIDEVVYFTEDTRLVETLAMRFEDYWTDTTGNFVDYANMDIPQPFDVRARYYPVVTQDPALNFPPTQDYATKAIVNYDREISIGPPNGAKIDVIMYRMSDRRHADEMIKAYAAGVPVRLITEEENYRDSRYIWHSFNADRMWAAGIPVKDHVHGKLGIVHQKSVILYAQKEVIFGSSNWSSASSNQQVEHNLFSEPCTPGQSTWCDTNNTLFTWFVAQFESKWNNANPLGFVEFRPFVPLPGGTPVNYAPANAASGIGTTGVVLKWDGGNWNHKYDVYLGTSATALTRIATDLLVGSPYTDQYEKWQIPDGTLAPGTTYYWRVVGKTMASGPRAAEAGLVLDKTGPIWTFTTTGVAAASTPYGGAPVALPGTIQAENFDDGGRSVAYGDTTAGNNGNVYRNTDVDIAAAGSAGNGYYVGWTRVGEWLNYTVSVGATGTYTLEASLANSASGAAFHVEIDGTDKTGTLAVPNTGGYTTWRTVTKAGLSLTAGPHLVRVVFDAPASNGGVGNLDALRFVSGTTNTPTPYGGVAASLPGRIQAENFDEGGPSVAYADSTAGNTGGAYRPTDVDLGATTDLGGGTYIGWTRAGEWLRYSVNVTTPGAYALNVRVANKGTGGRFHVEVDGVDVSGPLGLPNTGGWQTWTTVSRPGVTMSAGAHAVRLVLDAGTSENAGVGNYNWLEFVP